MDTGQHCNTSRLRLPASLDSQEKKIWAICSNGDLPKKMSPLTSDQEGKIVVTLIGELQRNLALDLDFTPIASRNVGSRGELSAASFLVSAAAMRNGWWRPCLPKATPPGPY